MNHLLTRCGLASWFLFALMAQDVRAQILTTNGGFESGLAGWTIVNQLGSNGSFFLQTGATSPVSGAGVPAPPGGIQAAMSDALGPGSHVLYQDFVVPTGAIPAAELRFDVFVGNRASAFFAPATLDFSTPTLNQQARIDIMTVAADPFSVSPGDVLQSTFQTNPGGPLVVGYNPLAFDITSVLAANPGATLRLRIAEVDNVFNFQLGIDNVVVIVPEPSSLALLGLAVAGGLHACRRRCRHGKVVSSVGNRFDV